jgi:hypothetical protein
MKSKGPAGPTRRALATRRAGWTKTLRFDEAETLKLPASGSATNSTVWRPAAKRVAPTALNEWRTGAALPRQSIELSFVTGRPSTSTKILAAASRLNGAKVPSV